MPGTVACRRRARSGREVESHSHPVPRGLEEAALLDGASRWTTFTRIIFPLARPGRIGDERAYTLPVVFNGYVAELGAQGDRSRRASRGSSRGA